MTGSGIEWPEAPPVGDGRHRLHIADIQGRRILAATIDVCAMHGAAAVTVAEVVARAGISRRTFYEQFDDTRQCLLAAQEHCVRSAAERVLPAFGSSGRWRVRVRAALVALLAFLDDEPAMARVLLVESLAAGPDALAHRARVVARLAGALEAGREQPGARAPELPALLGEWTVGAVLSVLHTHVVEARGGKLLELAGPLMSLIALPYLGPAAAREELERPREQAPTPRGRGREPMPLNNLGMRVTYRTMQVLAVVAEHPGSSNRQVGRLAGVEDQGQISKLLARLQKRGLLENVGGERIGVVSNAWRLTAAGRELYQLLTGQAGLVGG